MERDSGCQLPGDSDTSFKELPRNLDGFISLEGIDKYDLIYSKLTLTSNEDVPFRGG